MELFISDTCISYSIKVKFQTLAQVLMHILHDYASTTHLEVNSQESKPGKIAAGQAFFTTSKTSNAKLPCSQVMKKCTKTPTTFVTV
jgi:hypothetical protein